MILPGTLLPPPAGANPRDPRKVPMESQGSLPHPPPAAASRAGQSWTILAASRPPPPLPWEVRKAALGAGMTTSPPPRPPSQTARRETWLKGSLHPLSPPLLLQRGARKQARVPPARALAQGVSAGGETTHSHQARRHRQSSSPPQKSLRPRQTAQPHHRCPCCRAQRHRSQHPRPRQTPQSNHQHLPCPALRPRAPHPQHPPLQPRRRHLWCSRPPLQPRRPHHLH